MFDGLLRPAPEVFTGTSHVLSKVFAASQYPAVLNVLAHAFASPADLCAALLHLPFGSVVILLGNSIQRS